MTKNIALYKNKFVFYEHFIKNNNHIILRETKKYFESSTKLYKVKRWLIFGSNIKYNNLLGKKIFIQ